MTSISAPFGLRCVYHPSGEPRIATLEFGVTSGYATPLYNGSPVKLNDNGTLEATGAGADSTIGIFAGCFFTKNGVPQTLSNWPAGQTYDPDTPMWAQYQTIDPDAIYEAQANGPVDQIKLGEAINLADAPVGSSFTGQSTQRLDAATTGTVPGTFIVQNIAPYSDNNWGDPFTIVRVRLGTFNEFEWPFPGSDLDFEFTTARYYSGTLGVITADQAMTTAWSTGGLVFASNGLLQATAPNTAPVGLGRGLWNESLAACRISYNNTLSNAAWIKTNITATQDYPTVFTVPVPVPPARQIVVLPAGTTSWLVPVDWDNANNEIRCIGSGGHGAAGVAGGTRASGGSGASGGYAETYNVVLTPGGTVTGITVPAAGSAGDCKFPDIGGTTRCLAKSGTSGVGTAAGVAGSGSSGVGNLRRTGAAGRVGASIASNRGGPGGAGAPGPDSAAQAASLGNATGGGGGSGANAIGTGDTVSDASNGGRGGDGFLGEGHGVGGTATDAAVNATLGGGGGGGKSAVGINGSNGSNSPMTIGELTYEGPGGGGGGGGLGGDGGNGGIGAGGGGGGATDTLSGAGGLGGDGQIVITWGAGTSTPPGWRITATADGATITHTAKPVAIGPITTLCLPYAMMYWDGTPLTGAVELTMNDFVTTTDVTDQLVAGRWVQVAGDPELIASLPDPNVFGVRIAKAGDTIGFCLANIERNYTVTTPILTPGAAVVNRGNVDVTVNTANFPTLAGEEKFTVLCVVEPRMDPLPPVGDPDMPRLGWTVLEINNPYIVTGTGRGNLVPYGAPGEGSLMTIDSAEPGSNFAVGNRMLVGTGVGAFTDIIAQETGTPGGAGTYHVNSIQQPYFDGQTTPLNIILQSRLKDAQGYGFNAALKPDDIEHPFAQRIGLTITVETLDPPMNFGFDPQHVDYVYNEVNAEGFTLDLPALEGIVALKGDTELSKPNLFRGAPELHSDYLITLGSQYLGGVVGSGAPLDGVIQRVVIFRGDLTEEALAAATLKLQARYA